MVGAKPVFVDVDPATLLMDLDACEAAVMGAGARGFESRSGRFAAYEDLVDGVLAIGDYARKSDAVRWALRLRSRI